MCYPRTDPKTIKVLSQKMETMEVPLFRRDIKNSHNVRWLLRNLQARNKDHRHFQSVRQMLFQLLR